MFFQIKSVVYSATPVLYLNLKFFKSLTTPKWEYWTKWLQYLKTFEVVHVHILIRIL